MRIHYNYLSAPGDIVKLREGFRLARELAEQTALDPYRGEELLPGPTVNSDDDIDAYSSHHVNGKPSCKHMPHGNGWELCSQSGFARSRYRSIARRRRFRLTRSDLGAHERMHHHDGRKGRRHVTRLNLGRLKRSGA